MEEFKETLVVLDPEVLSDPKELLVPLVFLALSDLPVCLALADLLVLMVLADLKEKTETGVLSDPSESKVNKALPVILDLLDPAVILELLVPLELEDLSAFLDLPGLLLFLLVLSGELSSMS